MKILLVGNGGRENAIAWKICNSPLFINSGSKLYSTLPTPGLGKISEQVNINPSDLDSLLEFAGNNQIDFTVVGPELPLSLGIVNAFGKRGLKIFGPESESARLESSKVFAKNFMMKYGIPTSKFKAFDSGNYNEAEEYISELNFPIVIKADGLAAGKGVVIAGDLITARRVIDEFINEDVLGESGKKFLIEEFLEGDEVSVFAVSDGSDYILLPSSQDHKKIGEGDKGKNTGGMGAYAPADKFFDEELKKITESDIIRPVLEGMKKEGHPFKGCLYVGLMIVKTKEGKRIPYVIEFNCRFGDPETQAVLPLIKSDFLEMLLYSAGGGLNNYKLEIEDSSCVCVVLASDGYPDKYEKGKVISGLDNIAKDCLVFHSGTKYGNSENEILSNGGRVLSVVSKDKDIKIAISKCYKSIDFIKFENKYFRKDIGYKAL